MTQSPPRNNWLERLYAVALRLYPPPFREAYAPSMRQTFRDALKDRTLSRRTLIPLVLRDLAISLAKEHLAMLRETFSRPALLCNALVLTGLATGLAFALYSIPQQVLRLGANDPQIAMADDLAARRTRHRARGGRSRWLDRSVPQPHALLDCLRRSGQATGFAGATEWQDSHPAQRRLRQCAPARGRSHQLAASPRCTHRCRHPAREWTATWLRPRRPQHARSRIP